MGTAGTIEARDHEAIAALAGARWADGASSLLADLGFTLIHGDHPIPGDGAHLLVALRSQPTLRHFDPESMSLWVAAAGRGRATTIERPNIAAAPASALWGHVHVTDRLHVENRFLTFGGEIRTKEVSPQVALVDLRSPAPIVRWGGHSQGEDALAGAVGAFFSRMIVPIDFEQGVEERIASATPITLYAAFLVEADDRGHRLMRRSDGEVDPLTRWVDEEAGRIRRSEPEAWAAAGDLLAAIGLRR